MAYRKEKRGIYFWLFIMLIFFVGGRYLIQQPGFVECCCSYAMYPILVVQRTMIEPYKSWRAKRRVANDLAHCIETLSGEREQLLEEVVALKAELNYLDEIQELRSFKERYQEDNAVITQIIAKHFADDGHYFLIDAGEKQGIKTNMIVVYHNCLIGRVQEVYPLYSKVVAISDKSCKVAAYCAKTKTEGIHEGGNSLDTTALKFVSHLKEIVAGDFLLSSGEGLVFPRGFALGRVDRVERNGLFCEIAVKPLVDLQQINYCMVWHRGIAGEDELTVVNGTWSPIPERHGAKCADAVLASADVVS